MASPSDRPLARVLGRFDVTMLVMGGIVGAGVFHAPSAIAAGAGSLGGVLLLWVAGGVVALCGALVFAELGGMLPHAGGQYVFLREGYGRFAAFLFGWTLITTSISSAIAYVAGVFTAHLELVLRALRPGLELGDGGSRAVSVATIVLLTALNVRGVRLGATVQNVAMLAKISGLLLVVVLGVVAFFGGAEPSAAVAPADAHGGWSWSGVGAAMLGVVFTYGGWQSVAAVAGEIREPERTLPFGILAGTVLVVGLYVSMNWALVEILGVAGVAATETPVATAAGAVLAFGEPLVAALVMLSTFAITLVLLMLPPRIYYAMARDGVFFRSAGWVHPTWRTPAVAILLQGSFSVLHVFVGRALSDLLEVTVIADWAFFTMSGLALFLFRRSRPDAPRPYRAFGYPWLPAVFLASSLGIFVNALANAQWIAVQRFLLLVGAGAVLFVVWSRRSGATRS